MEIKYRKFEAHTSAFNLSNVESLKKLGKLWKKIFPDWKVFYYISTSVHNPNKISKFYYPIEEDMHTLVVDEYADYSNRGDGSLLCSAPACKLKDEARLVKLTCSWHLKFRHEQMLPFGNRQNVITMEIPAFYFDDPDFELQFGSFAKSVARKFKTNLLFDLDNRAFFELDYGLPQLGHLTIFGEPYLESIGEKILLTTPARNVEKFDDFILIETGGTPEEIRLAADHLGQVNFFKEIKPRHVYQSSRRPNGGCLFMFGSVVWFLVTRPLQYFFDTYEKLRRRHARASNIPEFDWSGILVDLPRNITDREKGEFLANYHPAFTLPIYLTALLIILAAAGSFLLFGLQSFLTIGLLILTAVVPVCKYIVAKRRNHTTCMIFKESGLDIAAERKKWPLHRFVP